MGSCIVGVASSAWSSFPFFSSSSFEAFFFKFSSSFPEQYYLISFIRESKSLNTWMPLPLFKCVGFRSHKLKESKWHNGMEYRVWVLLSKLKVLNFVTALWMDLGSWTVAPVTLSSLWSFSIKAGTGLPVFSSIWTFSYISFLWCNCLIKLSFNIVILSLLISRHW